MTVVDQVEQYTEVNEHPHTTVLVDFPINIQIDISDSGSDK